ncbi:hypothetical protein COXBURSA334_1648 [Coxiella burnetii Q321]|nr:hypothetical protein COXBURSA334_1648 [Coxiella burnetii Q321]
MRKRSLRQSNPHLKNPLAVKKAICRMVESSSAIEGINVKVSVVNGEFTVTAKEPSKK